MSKPLSTRRLLRLGAAAGSVTAMASGQLVIPAQAQTQSGPLLDATRSITINSAATFNNSYGTSFEAVGDVTGNASFIEVTQGGLASGATLASQGFVNSGTAFIQAAVDLTQDGAYTTAVAGISGLINDTGALIQQGTDSSGLALNTAGLANSAYIVNPSGITITGDSSGLAGGSFVGTNVGTEVIQAGGGLENILLNALSGF